MFGSQFFNGQRIPINASSAYAQEIAKWEAHYTQFGAPGRKYEELVASGVINRDYPAMLYKASRGQSGVNYEHAIARDENHRAQLEAVGWVFGTGLNALHALEQREFEMATAAAERSYDVRRMSAKAQAEVDAKESQTIQHLGEIPETPIKRMVKREDK